MFDFRPINCPTCEIDDAKVLGVRRRQTRESVPARIVQCRRCGLIYPNPFPFPNDVEGLYSDPESYFQVRDLERLAANAALQVRELAAMTDARRLLDVGCGRGEVVQAAQRAGLEAVGLEVSPAMVAEAKRLFDVEIEHATLEQYVARANARFDIVVMNAIVEHVHNPDSFMAAAARLIARGGVLFVDTPREPHLLTMLGKLTGKGVLNLSPTWEPFHVFGFNPRALRVLLRKHGFLVEQLKLHHGRPCVPGSRAGTLVMKAANYTPWAANMFCWARPT